MATFKTLDGQSIIDLCINIYGSLDYLNQLMNDNNLNFNSYIPAGTLITYTDITTPLSIKIATNDLLVSPFLAITSQPTGSTLCAGSYNPVLSVTVNAECSFRWQRSNSLSGVYSNLYDGSNYTGTDTADLTIISSEFEDHIAGTNTYYYRCVINGYIYSDSTAVTINTAPTTIYISEPHYPVEIHDNITWTAILDTYGGGITYEWYYTLDSGSSYTLIDGSESFGSTYFTGYDTRFLVANDASYGLNGILLKCKANCDCGGVTADSLAIEVNPPSFIPPVTDGLIQLMMATDMVIQTGTYYDTHKYVWADRLNCIIGTESYPTTHDPGYSNTGFISGGRARFRPSLDPQGINYVQTANFGTYSVGASVYGLHDELYGPGFDYYGGLSQSITIMGVAKIDNLLDSTKYYNNSGKAQLMQIGYATTGKAELYFDGSGKLYWNTKGNAGNTEIADATPNNLEPFIFTAQSKKRDTTLATAELYINGSTHSNTSRTIEPTNVGNFTYSVFQPNIGNNVALGGGALMNGSVGALLFYNRILSDTERQDMENWLNDYYSIF